MEAPSLYGLLVLYSGEFSPGGKISPIYSSVGCGENVDSLGLQMENLHSMRVLTAGQIATPSVRDGTDWNT